MLPAVTSVALRGERWREKREEKLVIFVWMEPGNEETGFGEPAVFDRSPDGDGAREVDRARSKGDSIFKPAVPAVVPEERERDDCGEKMEPNQGDSVIEPAVPSRSPSR